MKLRTSMGVSLIVAVGAVAAWFLIVRAPGEGARQLAEQIRAEFAKAFQFQPEIRVRSRTLFGQTKAVLELATARKEIRERYRLEHEWLGSLKVFEVEGRFHARAGYDLVEPISIQVDESPRQIRISLPPARLLGLELAGIRVLADEDGWWNKLTAKDRENALAEMQAKARQKIARTDLLPQADANFRSAVRDLLRTAAPGFAIEFAEPAGGTAADKK